MLSRSGLFTVQVASVTHHLRGAVPQKISNFLNQKSPISWDRTCFFFPLFIQSLWGGLPPNALTVEDKKMLCFHTVQHSTTPIGTRFTDSQGLTVDFLPVAFPY